MVDIKQIAPLQLIVLGFPEPKFEGRILEELNKLRENKMIRIVDALAVEKDEDGEITSLKVRDMPRSEAVEYGAVIGYLIGIGSGDEKIAEETALAAAMHVDNEYEYGMDPEELATIAEDIPEGGASLMLLIEHLWALPLKRAARDAGGILIAQDFLSPETLIGIGSKTFEAVSH